MYYRSHKYNTFRLVHLMASSIRSTSSIGLVVCESTPVIQLSSYMMDNNRSFTSGMSKTTFPVVKLQAIFVKL